MKKLFVDDMRPFPKSGYTCAGDYYEATRILARSDFDFASFDYHLGAGQNGLDILIWMKNNGKYIPRINIHSSHPMGRVMMRDFCIANFPGVKVTMETFDYTRE